MRLSVSFLRFTLFVLLVFLVLPALLAQHPQGQGRNWGAAGGQVMTGRFYGKVVDEATGKGIGYASVQLIAMQFDSVSRSRQPRVVAGQLTEENGDFSLNNIPVRGQYTLKISYMGYANWEQAVAFFDPQNADNAGPGGMNTDKDLGDIVLSVSSQLLREVTVTDEVSAVSLALDKKIYKVDKDGVAAGGTAEDALRNVPSLTVDIDGNLTMRNAAPQLFVDGRPTVLTLDQIPADAIDNVEVITNPSAKYDASGGNAGIVNIVLKKERKIGYNGNVRAGIDMRGKTNFGGDINIREGKVNGFLSAGFFDRKSLGNGETDRNNLFGSPLTNIYQDTESENLRKFKYMRGGLDWFVDNRNTLTFTGRYFGGKFRSFDDLTIQTDTLLSTGISSSQAMRNTENEREWRSYGGQILYKHIYPKPGKEWTADANLNVSRWDNVGTFNTTYLNTPLVTQQKQEGNGVNNQITAQTDYVEPIGDNIKIEAGARAAIRLFTSDNASFQYDYPTETYVRAPTFADKYEFNDQVYAAYGTFSQTFKNWGYQVGLRAESSFYTGTLLDVDSSFSNEYPLSLFPSVFLSYKLNEEDNLQASYSRRVNRPNFFQIIPFPDFSDSLLLSRGNPGLIPEFTNSFELSYQDIFNRSHNMLVSVYFKHAVNLITSYQFTEYNALLDRDVIVSTYTNSNSSIAYGLELTLKNGFLKRFELTSNLNLYNSRVNARNIESDLSREQFTWYVKENLDVKLPASFTFQVSGSYQSRTAFALDNGSRHGGWHGGPSSTAQGYTLPVWYVDLSLRKDLFKRAATITLSVRDIFRSRISGTYSESEFFTQEAWRRRDAQFFRLNFSWRFGKFDSSLFRRKNTKFDNGDDMGGGF
ncbi:MAG: TonB-dependent receptor [Bacteroidetes bacterium]|nr:MAG: TonB-dependent receptor [Bacteroidota bacterium]